MSKAKQIEPYLLSKLENRDIPLGEILRDKGFINNSGLEEALDKSQSDGVPLGIALLELELINQSQLKIALEDQAAIKKVAKRKQAGKRRLGDILLAAGALSQEQLSGALEFAAAHGIRIGEALVQLGIVTEDELAQSVAEQLMIPYIKLAKTPPDPLVVNLIQGKMALKHEVIPVKREDQTLYLAMVDPQNILIIDDIEKTTGLKIQPMIVASKDFQSSYEAFYGDAAQAGSLIEQIDDTDDKSLDDMKEEDFDEDSAPIKNLMNKIVTQAVSMGTSDVHIEPFEHSLNVRYRVDGMLRPGAGPFPVKAAAPIASRVKVMAGLDISEVRNPQDGKFRMSLKGKIVDVRVSTCPSAWGEKIVMRILDQSGNRLRLGDLGIDKENYDSLDEGLHSPNGILLVTGPTGSGKTTTLYSALVSLNKPTVNIQTAEDPVEYDLPGISQAQCLPEIGMTFAKVLKAFLRQDPDIILIGEIRDTETAQIALKAALTGHLVLSTLHTNSAVESIGRMLNMGIDRFLISSAVRNILAQRLMRRLCEKCKAPWRPSPKDLKNIGINERLMNFDAMKSYDLKNLTLYKAVGCRECGGNGYKGRMGIHEVMKMTTTMSEGIIRELSTLELKNIAFEDGMMRLRDCALSRVVRGISSVQEADRLTVNEQKAAETSGDEDLIDEILIRSGSWKLTPKELLVRKKSGLFVPGAKGKIDPFFLSSYDVSEVEKELAAMDGLEADSEPGGGPSPAVFSELLDEIRGLEARMNGEEPPKTTAADSISSDLLAHTLKSLKSIEKLSGDKMRQKVLKTVHRLEESLLLSRYSAGDIQPSLKKVPIMAALHKDFYAKLPEVAKGLKLKALKKVELNSIKFQKELGKEKVGVRCDWKLLKTALNLVLENHLEALNENGGGTLKIKTRIAKDKKNMEIIFHDLNPNLSQSHKSEELLKAGFTTRKGRSGLGLSAAHQILKAHSADLNVTVIKGKGCRSVIQLPLS